MVPASPAAPRALSPVRIAFLALVLGGGLIALSPVLVRLSEVGPTVTAFWRAGLAVPVLALALLAGRRPAPAPGPADRWRLAIAGIFFAGDLVFWHWSIQFTSIANATLFANFNPFFVAIGALLLFGERITASFVLGMALAFAGAACLLGDSLNLGGDVAFGDALGVATAMCWASYFLLVRSLRARLGTAAIMLWSTLATAVAVLPMAALSGEPFLPRSLAGWSVLVGLAVLSHALGQGLIAHAVGSSRVDLQACKLEYSIVSPK